MGGYRIIFSREQGNGNQTECKCFFVNYLFLLHSPKERERGKRRVQDDPKEDEGMYVKRCRFQPKAGKEEGRPCTFCQCYTILGEGQVDFNILEYY